MDSKGQKLQEEKGGKASGKTFENFQLTVLKNENCSEIHLPATTDNCFTAPYFGTKIGAESAYYNKVDFCCPGMFNIPELEICSFFLFTLTLQYSFVQQEASNHHAYIYRKKK